MIYGIFSQSKTSNLAEANSNSDEVKNFNDDLNSASSYWVHNNLAFDYAKNGQYENAADEYKTAIEVIENMPGDKWPNLKKEDVDRMNQQTRIDAQIFSRYGLAEALEKVGRYEEALQNVEWLIKNQQVKGKEELLKQKLEGMKQNILQKMRQKTKGQVD
jgi:tetratricopeptide (TPR) repeat protein